MSSLKRIVANYFNVKAKEILSLSKIDPDTHYRDEYQVLGNTIEIVSKAVMESNSLTLGEGFYKKIDNDLYFRWM